MEHQSDRLTHSLNPSSVNDSVQDPPEIHISQNPQVEQMDIDSSVTTGGIRSYFTEKKRLLILVFLAIILLLIGMVVALTINNIHNNANNSVTTNETVESKSFAPAITDAPNVIQSLTPLAPTDDPSLASLSPSGTTNDPSKVQTDNPSDNPSNSPLTQFPSDHPSNLPLTQLPSDHPSQSSNSPISPSQQPLTEVPSDHPLQSSVSPSLSAANLQAYKAGVWYCLADGDGGGYANWYPVRINLFWCSPGINPGCHCLDIFQTANNEPFIWKNDKQYFFNFNNAYGDSYNLRASSNVADRAQVFSDSNDKWCSHVNNDPNGFECCIELEQIAEDDFVYYPPGDRLSGNITPQWGIPGYNAIVECQVHNGYKGDPVFYRNDDVTNAPVPKPPLTTTSESKTMYYPFGSSVDYSSPKWTDCPEGWVIGNTVRSGYDTNAVDLIALHCKRPDTGTTNVISQTCQDIDVDSNWGTSEGDLECPPEHLLRGVYYDKSKRMQYRSHCGLECMSKIRCCKYDDAVIRSSATTIDDSKWGDCFKRYLTCYPVTGEREEDAGHGFIAGFHKTNGNAITTLDVLKIRNIYLK